MDDSIRMSAEVAEDGIFRQKYLDPTTSLVSVNESPVPRFQLVTNWRTNAHEAHTAQQNRIEHACIPKLGSRTCPPCLLRILCNYLGAKLILGGMLVRPKKSLGLLWARSFGVQGRFTCCHIFHGLPGSLVWTRPKTDCVRRFRTCRVFPRGARSSVAFQGCQLYVFPPLIGVWLDCGLE